MVFFLSIANLKRTETPYSLQSLFSVSSCHESFFFFSLVFMFIFFLHKKLDNLVRRVVRHFPANLSLLKALGNEKNEAEKVDIINYFI